MSNLFSVLSRPERGEIYYWDIRCRPPLYGIAIIDMSQTVSMVIYGIYGLLRSDVCYKINVQVCPDTFTNINFYYIFRLKDRIHRFGPSRFYRYFVFFSAFLHLHRTQLTNHQNGRGTNSTGKVTSSQFTTVVEKTGANHCKLNHTWRFCPLSSS